MLRRGNRRTYGLPRRCAPRNDDFEDLAGFGASIGLPYGLPRRAARAMTTLGDSPSADAFLTIPERGRLALGREFGSRGRDVLAPMLPLSSLRYRRLRRREDVGVRGFTSSPGAKRP
jgi:hypothetical protein